MHLFNYMVRPILLYCSDYWGCLKQPKNNPISKLHLSFCKQLLGVRKQTNTSAVLLELGLTPISHHGVKASIKNWERIKQGKCARLLTAAYTEATNYYLPWTSSIKEAFAQNGMLDVFLNNEAYNQQLHIYLCKRLEDQFHQTAFADLNQSSKLQLYSKLKTKIGCEKYLHMANVKQRHALTRLRLSSHPLHIETGRHNNTAREERLCPLCKNGIEDEMHFLLQCTKYADLRNQHFGNTVLPNHSDHTTRTIFLL